MPMNPMPTMPMPTIHGPPVEPWRNMAVPLPNDKTDVQDRDTPQGSNGPAPSDRGSTRPWGSGSVMSGGGRGPEFPAESSGFGGCGGTSTMSSGPIGSRRGST